MLFKKFNKLTTWFLYSHENWPFAIKGTIHRLPADDVAVDKVRENQQKAGKLNQLWTIRCVPKNLGFESHRQQHCHCKVSKTDYSMLLFKQSDVVQALKVYRLGKSGQCSDPWSSTILIRRRPLRAPAAWKVPYELNQRVTVMDR